MLELIIINYFVIICRAPVLQINMTWLTFLQDLHKKRHPAFDFLVRLIPKNSLTKALHLFKL